MHLMSAYRDWTDDGKERRQVRREIATGIQDFDKLRTNDRFYVDKTDFIREWWNGGR